MNPHKATEIKPAGVGLPPLPSRVALLAASSLLAVMGGALPFLRRRP